MTEGRATSPREIGSVGTKQDPVHFTHCGPLRRMIPRYPPPGADAIAAMVSSVSSTCFTPLLAPPDVRMAYRENQNDTEMAMAVRRLAGGYSPRLRRRTRGRHR